jgi:hypothetical protein
MIKIFDLAGRAYDAIRPQLARQRQAQLDIEQGRFGVILVHMIPPCLEHLYSPQQEFLKINQAAVLEKCSQKDVPVAVLEMPGYSTIQELARIIDSIPRHEYFSEKQFSNGFDENPDLAAMFRKYSIENIFLMGIYLTGCVKEVAKAALSRNCHISTSADLIEDDILGHRLEQRARRWFRRNGSYFENHTELVALS